ATGYEVAAFVWFQGWNELFVSPAQKEEYADNLVHLIHDLRASDDRIPADLPMIIPESSDQDDGLNASRVDAVATLNAESPGSAVFIENNDMKGNDWPGFPFSQEWGFHFNARAENYLEIGWRIGIAAFDSGYVDDGPLSLGTSVSSVSFRDATLLASINDDATTLTVVWDTVDHGRGNTADWPNSQELGGWTGGAGQVPTTLTNLQENTAYVFRFFATNTVLAAEAWSALGSFETPYENPPPLLSFTEYTPAATDGTIASTTLTRADATSVSIVWANADQGTTGIAAWQNAPGGGSADLGPASVDDPLDYQITGLDPNTDYLFRFLATNTFGTDWTPPTAFKTARDGGDFQLTAYYNFEGEEPGATNDYPGAGSFADNLVNNGTWFVPDVPTNASGSTQAAAFDGNVALYTDAFTTDLGPDPDAFTIMFWIKAADASQENNNTRLMTTRIKPAGAGNASKPAWQVEGFGNNGNNGNKMDVRMSHPTASNWFSPDATGALADFEENATWHHVAFVLANSGHPDTGKNFAETFVDGFSIGGPQTQREDRPWDNIDIANTDGMLIIGGAATNGSSRGFTGLLDDVALFAGVVPAADIAAVADGLKNPADFLPPTDTPPFDITAITVGPDGQITLTWQSQPGETYNLLWSPDLTTPPVTLSTPVQATAGSTTTTIDNPSPGATQLYLRVSRSQ
ncbi:MAG: hypothetical protein P8J87_04245, partial [Verrucomicrobiales bacterium]|nr:hypothetical protein [Verrucomicrobiales bacterium]